MYYYQFRLLPTNKKLLNSFISFPADSDETAHMVCQCVCEEMNRYTDMENDTGFTFKLISKVRCNHD